MVRQWCYSDLVAQQCRKVTRGGCWAVPGGHQGGGEAVSQVQQGAGEARLLPRMAALPRWSRMPILLQRWEMASPLLLPNVPCEGSAQLLHLSPCTNMPVTKRCLVSYTPLLPRSFFSQRHGSKRDRLCGPLLAWWQPGGALLW